ncbi:unnamed protein product [Orchesella dallaii]|uniref:Cytochrome b561 domain-containing protein n=1 Tax=Orchesella dallaii TaxID=48710 RepID=A0ABP1QSQ6_9HEXA
MEDIGVMQGQPQQVSESQVRYLQGIMDRPSDLQRRIDLLESKMPDWNWAEECETEKWTSWWRHTVLRVAALICYNFLLCLVSGVISIEWDPMRSLFLHRSSDSDRSNDRTNIALLVLFVKIIAWYCGRKVHTGRILTWLIIVADGLTTAFIYNAGMYSIAIQSNIEIIYPLLIAAPQIIVNTTTLLHVGIRLTLRSRKVGVKRLPFVLAILQAITLLLLFVFNAGTGKGSLVENRDLFLHGLAGTVSGMLITLGMACYIVARLQNKLVSENVREMISMYSLARRADFASEVMMMPPCELDPGGSGVV